MAADAATIAAIIQAPERLSPFVDPKRTLQRRNYVVQRMAEEKYVTRESQASLYDTRLSSRAHYTELVAKGGEWTAPVVVRNELGAWRFAAADQRMTEALTVLEKREQIRRLSEGAGATPPTSRG